MHILTTGTPGGAVHITGLRASGHRQKTMTQGLQCVRYKKKTNKIEVLAGKRNIKARGVDGTRLGKLTGITAQCSTRQVKHDTKPTIINIPTKNKTIVQAPWSGLKKCYLVVVSH